MENHKKTQQKQKKQKFQQLRTLPPPSPSARPLVRHHNGITEKPRKNKKKQKIQRKCLKIDEKP